VLSKSRQMYPTAELIWAWTYRIVRARYQQSALGGAWAIIQPTASAGVFTMIFTFFIPIDTGAVPYMVFSYVAMVPWTLLSSAMPDMIESLTGNMNLVSKIYFPRETLPISAMLARLIDFAIAFVCVAFLIAYFHMPVWVLGWLFLPVILTIQLLLILGLGLAGAALNVFYRDVRHIFILGLQLWFYASPIIYPVSVVENHLGSNSYLYYLNPMSGIIEAYRAVLLHGQFPGPSLVLSAAVALTLFAVGFWLFKRVEFQFADVV